MANGHGGARPGGGRKKKADEARVRDLAVAAIVKVYGSEEEGFEALLKSQEPVLVKWVHEHAYGKPTEFIDVTTREEEKIIVDFEEEGEEGSDQDDDETDDDEDQV